MTKPFSTLRDAISPQAQRKAAKRRDCIQAWVLDYIAEAQKWLLVDTDSVIRAFEETLNPEQVRSAIRRLRRARKVIYSGPRSAGYWRTTRTCAERT